jgi:hypothetical protein
MITVNPPPKPFTTNIIVITDIQGDENAYKNGIYEASSSSYSSKANLAYNAFNTESGVKNDTHWKSAGLNNDPGFGYTQDPYNNAKPSTYVGGGSPQITWVTRVDNVDISGEWIQMKIPYKIYASKYSLVCPQQYPRKFYFLGSNDGKKWSLLDSQNLMTLPSDPKVAQHYKTVSTEKYSHFRLILSELFEGSSIAISQFNITGFLTFNYEGNAVPSGNTVTSGNAVPSGNTVTSGNAVPSGNTVTSGTESFTSMTKYTGYMPYSKYDVLSISSITSTQENFDERSGFEQRGFVDANIIRSKHQGSIDNLNVKIDAATKEFVYEMQIIKKLQKDITKYTKLINRINVNVEHWKRILKDVQDNRENAAEYKKYVAGVSLGGRGRQRKSNPMTVDQYIAWLQNMIKPQDNYISNYEIKIDDNEMKLEPHEENANKQNDIINATVAEKRKIYDDYIKEIEEKQLKPLEKITADYVSLMKQLDANYIEMSGNIAPLRKTQHLMMRNNDYDYSGTSFALSKSKPTMTDAIYEDTYTMMIQQNNMYVLGTITVAVLLVASIMLSSD